VLLAVVTFFAVGNFASFYEIAIAVALDGNSRRLRLLPFLMGGFMASLMVVTEAFFLLLWSRLKGEGQMAWDKTPRFRSEG
jgi:hypothetical protein